MSSVVFPAYLGWGNPERDVCGVRFYATDNDQQPRWDRSCQGGRVAEYAAAERGATEGDRYLIVRVGNRFVPDKVMLAAAAAVEAALAEIEAGS